jgi:hypothetical protein
MDYFELLLFPVRTRERINRDNVRLI